MDDPFDTSRLEPPPACLVSSASNWPPRADPKRKFLCGPIPYDLFRTASALPGKALAVWLEIWLECCYAKAPTVSITLARLTRSGICTKTASRAVQALEKSGLINVRRVSGHSLEVTFLDAPSG